MPCFCTFMIVCMYVCVFFSTQDGSTALMLAARMNDIKTIEVLLKGEANCNLQNKVMPVIYVHIILLLKAWLTVQEVWQYCTSYSTLYVIN